ncbi:MAG: TetR/AcrR family transcriptional regulator [bacterium]
MDRRVARTRGILQEALNRLTLKSGYEAVTIKHICDEANVGRSTFYAHFTSKDDLKRSGLEHLRHHLLARQRAALTDGGAPQDRTLSFSLVMLEHARDHTALYRALVNDRGGSVALGFIREMLGDLIRTETTDLPFTPAQDRLNREFVVQYLVGAFMSVMIWWLDGGAKLTPQQVDGMFRSLTMDGMSSLYPPVTVT